MGHSIKNRNDVRFLKVQEKLEHALAKFLRKNYVARLCVPDLSREAKVWDSTFYDHYDNLDDAITQFSHKYDSNIKDLRHEVSRQNCSLEIAYAKILHFIYKNRDYYRTSFRCQNPTPIFSIITIFRPIIMKGWSNFNLDLLEFCFRILTAEVYAVIGFWGTKEKFNKDRISYYANYLARLSQNSAKRLS